ncbi:hypothetical protein F4823DRAFT_594393 [Ustulina deusta]|nr:hypothetical protein F4823DRAFT_594393 [Ustulina deusta]
MMLCRHRSACGVLALVYARRVEGKLRLTKQPRLARLSLTKLAAKRTTLTQVVKAKWNEDRVLTGYKTTSLGLRQRRHVMENTCTVYSKRLFPPAQWLERCSAS